MSIAYNSRIFPEEPDWEIVPVAEINSFHWENEKRTYRPKSYAQFCAVKDSGFHARMWSFEDDIRCENSERDEPMYEDSCLECFINPNPEENSFYLNFEMNPKGAYLSQIGENRFERSFFAGKTDKEATVTPFTVNDNGAAGWGVALFVPFSLFESLGIPLPTADKSIVCAGNFYKCGDKTVRPHYGAHFPVDTEELGFHNPKRFGKIVLTHEEI